MTYRFGVPWMGSPGTRLMRSADSITVWARQLGAADPKVRDAAARAIWERYAPRLLALVRRKLTGRVRRREDEDDILQNAYQRFCIAVCKAANAAKHHGADCRDVAREEQEPAPKDDDSLASRWLLEHAADGEEPDPAAVVELHDQIEWLLRLLPADLRQVVLWRLEGRTNQEIAGLLGRTERTVEMKLQRVRHRWERAGGCD